MKGDTLNPQPLFPKSEIPNKFFDREGIDDRLADPKQSNEKNQKSNKTINKDSCTMINSPFE